MTAATAADGDGGGQDDRRGGDAAQWGVERARIAAGWHHRTHVAVGGHSRRVMRTAKPARSQERTP